MAILRSAAIEDAKLFFDLWNENVLRTRAGKILTWEEHVAWFSAALQSSAQALFVYTTVDSPLGIARATLRDGQAHCSWALVSFMRGKGFGRALVQEFVASLRVRFPGVSFVAEIKSDNISSLRIVGRLGFVKTAEQDGFTTWRL